jgi:xylulokinase
MFCTFDLGSTKTEIILYGNDLCSLGGTEFQTPFVRENGIVFLDPATYTEDIFRNLSGLLNSLGKNLCQEEDLYCTVTGMGSTILATDRRGNVLVPCLSWEFQVPGAKIEEFPLSRTGKLLLPTYPLFKIPWMKNRLGGKDALFLSLPDYVLAKLMNFQEIQTDYSFASRSLLFNDETCDWDEDILAAAGLSRKNLPSLSPAGTILGEFDPSLKHRLGLRGAALACAGMHDHVATGYLGRAFSRDGKPFLMNPAGTTESVLAWSEDPEQRAMLVKKSPILGINTESGWRKDVLALVVYPSLSGKILDTARRFGVEPEDLFEKEPLSLIVAPSRRRLVVEDPGFVIAPQNGRGTLDDFWRSLILGTQFEFLRAVEDLEDLMKEPFSTGILLFGGQARDEPLCRLKSAVVRRPVLSFPGINGAALGAALAVAEGMGKTIHMDPLREICRRFSASEREKDFFRRQYERYKEFQ